MQSESTETSRDEAAALTRMAQNLKKVEALTERLTRVLATRKGHQPALDGPDSSLFAKAAQSYWSEAMTNPARLMEQQMGYWTKTVTHFVEAQQALAQQGFAAPQDDSAPDKRFANPLWQSHPYFNFVKQQYLINAEALRQAAESAEGLAPAEKKRLVYFTQQIIAMMSPTNFLATNPDALERAVETEGESLVRGLENMISDLEANNGELVVRLADDSAFELGRNQGD